MPMVRSSGPHAVDINFIDVGAGQPVVLIHGWPLSHRMWESQVNALTENGFRCIAYDRRGFGDSGHDGFEYDYDVFAEDLQALMVHLDLRDAVLVGFSMGGGEVARYLARYGNERVASAVFLGAVTPFLLRGPDNPAGVDGKIFDEMLAAVKTDRIAFLQRFFIDFYNAVPGNTRVAQDLVAYSKAIAWMASPMATQKSIVAFGTTDFRADLATITVPTLIVHGGADRIVPLAASAPLTHALIRDSRLEIIRGAPHGFAVTHAAELNAILLDFLQHTALPVGARD